MTDHLYPHLGQRIETPLGGGWLWQVFADRVAVVLDVRPDKVIFLTERDGRVNPVPANGKVAPWRVPRERKKKLGWRQAASFFGMGEADAVESG